MPRTPPLLPHQLVARDDRSSYLSRVDTLAGPGAYAIPSTFKVTKVNAHMRHVHHKHYGREFARQLRLMAPVEIAPEADDTPTPPTANDDPSKEPRQETTAQRDKFEARRERLRELLQATRAADLARGLSRDATSAPSPTRTVVALSPSAVSCASNYDVFVTGYREQQQQSQTPLSYGRRAHHRFRSPASPFSVSSCDYESVDLSIPSPSRDDVIGVCARGPRRSSLEEPPSSPAVVTPVSYPEYLATTSYSKRLKKHRPRTSQTSNNTSSSIFGNGGGGGAGRSSSSGTGWNTRNSGQRRQTATSGT